MRFIGNRTFHAIINKQKRDASRINNTVNVIIEELESNSVKNELIITKERVMKTVIIYVLTFGTRTSILRIRSFLMNTTSDILTV